MQLWQRLRRQDQLLVKGEVGGTAKGCSTGVTCMQGKLQVSTPVV